MNSESTMTGLTGDDTKRLLRRLNSPRPIFLHASECHFIEGSERRYLDVVIDGEVIATCLTYERVTFLGVSGFLATRRPRAEGQPVPPHKSTIRRGE